jgi:hypothetical protein
MTIHIELKPDEERALIERARQSGHELSDYIHQVIQAHILSPASAIEDLLDHEAVEACAREIEGKIIPTLEEVLRATSKIKDSMARVIIEEERADRF